MNLPNSGALVTGAKRIGAVIATHLASRGANVAVCYNRSHAEAEAVALAIRDQGRLGIALQADLAQFDQAQQLVRSAAQQLGRLDILVNVASVYARTDFTSLDEAAWDAALSVDLKATYACSLAAVPFLRHAGAGRIVNFADWTARSSRPRYIGYLPYYVAKSGVIALTEALALELAPDNILVNCVAPGPIVPPPGTSDEERRQVEQATPLGRWGGELEIAKAVIALIESDFITGETIRVDGGRHVY